MEGQNFSSRKKEEKVLSVSPIMLNGKNGMERMKEIMDQLEKGIREVFDSERYKQYLMIMAKFHQYSFNSTILIAMQGGRLVAGYQKWGKDFHRNVKKGERGIKILAPAPYRVKKQVEKRDPFGKFIMDADGKPVIEEQEEMVMSYKIATVFDISQTEGEPLPSLAVSELIGDVDRYKSFWDALQEVSSVPIALEDIGGEAHGYYHRAEKRIAVQDGMSQMQTLKTTVHEIAHARLHAGDNPPAEAESKDEIDQQTREVQAESVAYVVCQYFGLDTSEYSFGYVVSWSSGRELRELRASLETIQETSHQLITEIERALAGRQPEKVAEEVGGVERKKERRREWDKSYDRRAER